MRSFLPFAALLGVALLLGCQDVGTGPDGLVPQFDKPVPGSSHEHGGGGDDDQGTFAVTFSQDVIGDGVLLGPHGGKNGLQQEHNVPVDLPLSLSFQDKVIGNGATCFGTQDIASGMQVSQVTPSNTEDAVIRFFFDAKGTDGTDVNYGLTVLGKFQSGAPWPPTTATTGSNTITGKTFVLAHSNGPGNKVACTGEGKIGFSLTVTRTS